MKLLMINHHYFPSIGGGQEYVKLLSEGLVKEKHEVTVYTTESLTNEDITSIQCNYPFFKKGKKVSLPRKEEINGVKVERFPVKWRLYSFNWIPSMFKQLKDLKEYDIITAYGFNLLTSLVACRQAKKQGKPFILNGVDVLIPKNLPSFAKVLKWVYDRTWARYLIKNSKYIISFTKDHHEEYIKRGAKKAQMRTIPPPLVIEEYKTSVSEEFKQKYNIKDQDNIILYAGRITQHKGIQDIIKILPEIRKKIDNVKFFIAGKDYGFKKELEELIKKKNVQDIVFFVGPFKAREKELIEFFARANVFTLPSNMEGFGIVLIEAMACKTPCIAYNISAVREVIKDQNNGFLVNSRDEMKEKIISVLSNRSLQDSMSAFSREYATKFSQEEIVRNLENIYKNNCNSQSEDKLKEENGK